MIYVFDVEKKSASIYDYDPRLFTGEKRICAGKLIAKYFAFKRAPKSEKPNCRCFFSKRHFGWTVLRGGRPSKIIFLRRKSEWKSFLFYKLKTARCLLSRVELRNNNNTFFCLFLRALLLVRSFRVACAIGVYVQIVICLFFSRTIPLSSLAALSGGKIIMKKKKNIAKSLFHTSLQNVLLLFFFFYLTKTRS